MRERKPIQRLVSLSAFRTAETTHKLRHSRSRVPSSNQCNLTQAVILLLPHEPIMHPNATAPAADQTGSNSLSLLGIRSYGSAKPGIALRRPAQASRWGQLAMSKPPSAMKTMRPQHPISAIVQTSPTRNDRVWTVLSTKDNAASPRGRYSAIVSGWDARNRAEWRTLAT